MGVVNNVSADKFPKQGRVLNQDVWVCFDYDTKKSFPGVCLRDDIEEPFETIFLLNDSRIVRAQECQYTY